MVADAAAIVDTLVAPRAATGRVLRTQRLLHAPDLVGLETLHALRGLVRGGKMSRDRAARASEIFAVMPIVRHRHAPLEPRVWALRERMSAYDAAYVALAETLDAPLLTADRRLARAAAGLIEIIVPA